jgi:DNA-binding beta-propeller fold protein YncE
MPPLQLTSLLQDTLPHLSYKGRAVLSALGCVNGRAPGSAELAAWLGFHDRYQFARAMRREGLPPLETLGGWARTLYWLLESESSGVTLRELAERDHLDPAIAYRLVRRVTGLRWSEIRREGLALTLLHFRDQCRDGLATKSATPYLTLDARGGGGSAEVAGSRRASVVGEAIATASASRSHRPAHLRGTLGERVPVSGSPFDIALTPTDLALVTRGHAAALEVLRLSPPRIVHSIHVGPVPTRVVPSVRGDVAYVTSQFSEAIDVVDLALGRQTATLRVTGHPLGAVLSTDGQTLYVSTNRDRLVALAVSGRAVAREIPIPHGSPQVCMHPSGRRIYASGFRTGLIAEVEVPALHTLRVFDVGGIVQDVAVTADGQMLYAANESGWLDAIHLASGKRCGRLPFGTAALGLALSVDQADVAVGLLHAGRVVIVDRTSLAVRATLPTGGRPRLMATSAQGRVLVVNEAGWVDFIS